VEALSATGLRSVRYAKEIEGLEYVIANDIDPMAVQSIERNAKFNSIPEGVIRTENCDAKFLMHKLLHERGGKPNHPDKSIHAVDLDPYGGTLIYWLTIDSTECNECAADSYLQARMNSWMERFSW
jgi:tRNA (guanine26-N2/guanine27-N2)-dimethyltransferase